MKGFYYENKNSSTFLIYRMQPGDELDAFSLGMVTNNRIPGLIPLLFTQMNDERQFMYNVTSKVSLRQYISGRMTRKKCIRVFEGITASILSCDEYMLDTSALLTGLDHIFINVGTGEVSLVCLPICGRDKLDDLTDYFRDILCGMLFSDTESMEYPALILNYLNGGGNFSLQDLRSFLQEIRGEDEEDEPQTDAPQTETPERDMEIRRGESLPPSAHYPAGPGVDEGTAKSGIRRFLDRLMKKRLIDEETEDEVLFAVPGIKYPAAGKGDPLTSREEPLFFGGTAFPGDDEAGLTTVLGGGPHAEGPTPYLIRTKTGERVMIEGDIFKLGKEKSYVDYFIGDNPSVSRSHADIIRQGDEFRVIDNNSTNHTFLGGRQIPPNEEVPLEDGTEILLGNEGFTFHLS